MVDTADINARPRFPRRPNRANGDFDAAAAADRMAGQHMEMIADPLAAAIVAKLPDKFS